MARTDSLDTVLFPILEEIAAFLVVYVLEPKNFLTAESWTLHYAAALELVGCDDGTTGWTGVGNNAHD